MKCELPYKIGTFIRAKGKIDGVQILGTVAAYELYDDGYMIWVSGYRESICGVFLPEDVVPLTDEEIYELKKAKKYIDEEVQEETNKFYAFSPPMPNPPCARKYWEDFEEK